jgi:Gpi18-like mannosyltransferase
MAKSCEWAMSDDGLAAAKSAFNKKPRKPKTYKAPQEEIQESKKLLALIALPQTTLATFTLTNAHVQIITRLASGYPVWYWWLATMIMDEGEPSPQSEKRIFTKSICIWMVMYALVQGGLYASFLPPA